jgi:type I restriction enzyme R subunit
MQTSTSVPPYCANSKGWCFDLLTKPEPKLTKAQHAEVKQVARDLLMKLQDQLNVFDWRARQQTRAAVQSAIRFTLNELPEEPYPERLCNEKVDAVWAFVFARQHNASASTRGSAGLNA